MCVRVYASYDKPSSSEHKVSFHTSLSLFTDSLKQGGGDLPRLERVEPVTNDYFLAPFLITFPHSGNYTLHTTASLMDQKVSSLSLSLSPNPFDSYLIGSGVGVWTTGKDECVS